MSMTRHPKLAIAAVAFVFLAAVLVAIFYRAAPPSVALPRPNGYDDFVEATKVLVRSGDWRTQDVANLRWSVQQNARALALMRSGLSKECRVALQYGDDYTSNAMPRLGEFKALAQAFVAEGRLAQKEGRTNDALRSYLDCARFGEASARGGVLLDKLVGLACEATGREHLRQLLPSLHAADLRQLQEALGELHRNSESAETVIQHEREWSRRSFPGLRYTMLRWFTRRVLRQGEEKFRDKCAFNEAALRVLRTEIALRLYQLETGAYPAKLEALVPQYLDSVPVDPFSPDLSGLIYKPQTNSYSLYSVGPDGKDDGGQSFQRLSRSKWDVTPKEP